MDANGRKGSETHYARCARRLSSQPNLAENVTELKLHQAAVGQRRMPEEEKYLPSPLTAHREILLVHVRFGNSEAELGLE